jgi:hypothetical protein
MSGTRVRAQGGGMVVLLSVVGVLAVVAVVVLVVGVAVTFAES